MSFPVLLTTSGTGSRLGDLTRSTNKALLPVAGKATISRIVEAYPADVEFIVTLGYRGEEVRAFLAREHPARDIRYVWVDRYEGPGSSLGYTMLQARPLIERPFVFHACDTLVTEPIPPPEDDWIGGMVVRPEESFAPYRTHVVEDGTILSTAPRKSVSRCLACA